MLIKFQKGWSSVLCLYSCFTFAGLPDETFLVPLGENDVDELETPEQFGFICDLYFLTQQALYYGAHAMHERLEKNTSIHPSGKPIL